MPDPTPAPTPDNTPRAPSWLLPFAPAILKVVTHIAAMIVAAIATYFGLKPAAAPAPQVEVHVVKVPVPIDSADENVKTAGPDTRYARGWVKDDEAVKAIVAGLPHPVFADTPAGQVEAVPDHVYLWELGKLATGAYIPTRDQGQVGSCVSFGSACAVEYSQCAAIVAALKAGRPPPEFKSVSQEVIYGGSRVQIGGGKIRGDGSVGAWAAQWCQQYGSVARGVYGSIDLSKYSESRCRSYGNSGCPKALVPEAKLHPTKTISQVRTTDEAKKALASGYPVTVCSDVGFGNRGPYVRNSLGQLRASGSWAHCMCLLGYDSKSGFLIQNSWGPSWVSGPKGPGDPPDGSFYADEKTVARMLAQDDSWAFSDTQGFAPRKPDWFVHTRPERFRLPDLFAHSEVSLSW